MSVLCKISHKLRWESYGRALANPFPDAERTDLRNWFMAPDSAHWYALLTRYRAEKRAKTELREKRIRDLCSSSGGGPSLERSQQTRRRSTFFRIPLCLHHTHPGSANFGIANTRRSAFRRIWKRCRIGALPANRGFAETASKQHSMLAARVSASRTTSQDSRRMPERDGRNPRTEQRQEVGDFYRKHPAFRRRTD